MHNNKAYKVAYRGILIGNAIVLAWVEMQFSAFLPVPGLKLGLTNLVVLVALYKMGERDAMLLNAIRILLVGLMFGNLFSLVYSFAGGMLSTAVMILLKRTKRMGVTGVSMAGGITHNIGQVLVAMLVLRTKEIVYYLPVLWVGGIVAGIIIGILGMELIKRLPDTNKIREVKV